MGKYEQNTLSGVLVNRAMRRLLVKATQKSSLASAITTLIKYKISGLLAVDELGHPSGVLSKSDIVAAYYADLPLNSPVEDIMSVPPLFCDSSEPLEKALETMRENGVYRLFVADEQNNDKESIVGSLTYPDIVGLLYQFCVDCEYSHHGQTATSSDQQRGLIKRKHVKDVMTNEVKTVSPEAPLIEVLEMLSMYRIGALLVGEANVPPSGVISKTDMILAYKRGTDTGEKVKNIMSKPVYSCSRDDLLEDAIRQMIFCDVHRLFVTDDGDRIHGVFTLTDASRSRSGSCHACISSRIKLEDE